MFKGKMTGMVGILAVAFFLLLLIFLVPGKASAAYDCFLRVSDFSGGSSDEKHKAWIDVISWSFGETNSGTAHTGGGAGAGRVAMQDFKFVKRVDRASVNLFLACATGKHIKEVILEVCRSGGDMQRFLKITLHEVIVSSFETLGSSGSIDSSLLEKVSLSFERIEIEALNIHVGWDLKTTKGIGSLPSSSTRISTTPPSPGKTSPSSQASCFLKVGGFEGESLDQAHKGWNDVVSWSFGESNSAPIHTSGGAGVRRVVIQDLNFVKRMDKSSPYLFLACALAARIPEAVLEVWTSTLVMRITLSDVIVSSYISLGNSKSTEAYPMEEVSLNFKKIKIEYTGAGGPATGGWDLMKGVKM